MIAKCPECAARYRVDDAKVGASGARIRCAKCSTVFRIGGPASPAPLQAPAHPDEVAAPAERRHDPERLVVVATDREAPAAALVSALEAWGLQALRVSDGAEAMLMIQRHEPRAVILDARLPGMNGLQICEVVKRNESLREISIVLVADPADSQALAGLGAFGADAERGWGDEVSDLLELLGGFGLPVKSAVPAAPGGSTAGRERPPAAADGLDGERAKAERLARVVISDLVLYRGEAFDRANRSGTLAEEFRIDLGEGRQLLADRVDTRVLDECDHLLDELMRVAEDRRKD
ncbi:MAG: zinc-ribbon domain-containing protein [Myxococcota bacterium]|nr:zinc-ribbon domain-containing protein [Myxococcota bacterium]